MDFYIHQIGNYQDKKTYQTMINILKCKMIASREYLEKNFGIIIKDDERSFDRNIPKNGLFYDTLDVHKDKVSLSDPNDRLVRKSIENKSHSTWTCFDYDNIAFMVDKNIELVDDTRYLVPGEVQVQDKIDLENIIGLTLPFTLEMLNDEANRQIIEMVANICEQNNMPLDIYNYEGELIYKTSKKTK